VTPNLEKIHHKTAGKVTQCNGPEFKPSTTKTNKKLQRERDRETERQTGRQKMSVKRIYMKTNYYNHYVNMYPMLEVHTQIFFPYLSFN
jgi:hypothetical protein